MKWISVKDKLPEDDSYKFIYFKEHLSDTEGMFGIGFYEYSSWEIGKVYGIAFEGLHYDFDFPQITHWMDLPEPPKGSTTELPKHGYELD